MQFGFVCAPVFLLNVGWPDVHWYTLIVTPSALMKPVWVPGQLGALAVTSFPVPGQKVNWPLLGLNGPLTNVACPGGLLLPDWVVQPAVAFVTRKIGEEPKPAIFPEQVTSVGLVCVHVGEPMKCGLAANATTETAAIAPTSAAKTT